MTVTRSRTPLVGGTYPAPPRSEVSCSLILGSILFGIGWGLVGLCPGQALASITYGGWQGALFLVAMLAVCGRFRHCVVVWTH